MSAQHKKFTSPSNNFAESILSLKQNQAVDESTSPREYESTDIDLVLTAKAFWNTHKWPHFELLDRAVTVQFETRAGVGQPQTISRQTGKTAHSPITGVGAVRRGVLKIFLSYFLHSSQKAGLQLSSAILSGKMHI